MTKLNTNPYGKGLYSCLDVWQNTAMKSLIINELKEFFAKYPQTLPYHLAISAEVDPSIVHNAIKGKREDMFSSTADKLRAAMRRFEAESSLVATAETPTEPGEVNHGNG